MEHTPAQLVRPTRQHHIRLQQRPHWRKHRPPRMEKITQELNPLQRTHKFGDTYTHTITKSELYQGQQVTYYVLFDKCDRVDDYWKAWEWFEGVIGEENENL